MSTTLPHTPGEHGEPPAPAPGSGRGPGYYAFKAAKALSSLQLTVGLLAVGVLLVFFGTLAQIDFGIWTVVDKYFWSWKVDVPFELFRKFLNVFWKEWFPATEPEWKGSFPFPAGKLLGALMLVNLLAAHATRFKLTWKRAGVFLIHGGLILLFVGEFVTREFAVEQQMRIEEGSSTDFTIDTRNVELALVDPTNPGFDRVAAVAQKRLRDAKPGDRISHPDLPVDVQVLQYMKNSSLLDVPKTDGAKPGVDTVFMAAPGATEPAAYVRLHLRPAKDSKSKITTALGTFAVAPSIKEQRFGDGGALGRIVLKDGALTVVDESSPAFDRTLKITLGRLEDATPGTRLGHPDAPVEVEVLKYVPKAEAVEVVRPAKADQVGFDGQVVLVEAGEESGVAMNQRGDATAAYVRLYKKGTDDAIGVYAVGVYTFLLDRPVLVGDVAYRLSLRNAHYQKPYRVYLDKFSFDRYEGTQKAKNYSSDVKVYEPGNPDPVRVARIRMNEPLRYAGETFYQSSFDEKTEKATILQVVKNPGQIDFGLFHASIDYIACAVVSTGLLLHFGIFLLQFLFRAARGPAAPAEATVVDPAAPPAPRPPVPFTRVFPWLVLAVMVVYLLSIFGRMTPARQPYDLDAFGRLPVVDGGRVKPLDSVARVNLRLVSGREEFEDENGKKQPAIKWYLDVMATGDLNTRGAAWDHKVIRVDNELILNELQLSVRDGLRYSLRELAPNFQKIAQASALAQKKVKAKIKLDTTEMKYDELEKRITTVLFKIAEQRGPNPDDRGVLVLPPQAAGEGWKALGEVRAEVREKLAADIQAESKITDEQFAKMSKEEKEKLGTRLKAEADRREPEELAKAHPAAPVWDRILSAYRAKDGEKFNAAVGEYRAPTLAPGEVTRTKVEILFNRFAPFYQCTGLYVIDLVLALVMSVVVLAHSPNWSQALRRSSTLVLALACLVHFLAMLVRMYIMDRPGVFVTNLYSSAVFIGCGCVALCLVLELMFPRGIGNMVAAALGFATCVVAHNLANEDTLEMMQAVLDTNFWLATHVTTVTLGYTATFVAGFLGTVYLVLKLAAVVRDGFQSKGEPTVGALLAFGAAALGLAVIPAFFVWFVKAALAKLELVHPVLLDGAFFLSAAGFLIYALVLMVLRISIEGFDAQGRPLQGQVPPLARPVAAMGLTPEGGKILGQMIYGVLAFATLLSFVGTVLGGIWADQSWGRFWGWDPKENGAVLIVLWNALILHARWCGLVKDRGVAALAVVGNMITAWSWFGTNQLGIGLHAYGFDSRLADGCFNFWLLEGAIVLFGASIPRHFWSSAIRQTLAAPALPVAEVVAPAPAAPASAPATPVVGAAPNGHSNGNGHSRRDKNKKNGKRR